MKVAGSPRVTEPRWALQFMKLPFGGFLNWAISAKLGITKQKANLTKLQYIENYAIILVMSEVPSVKVLEAIKPVNSGIGEETLTYNGLVQAVEKYKPANAYRSAEF